ncbi:hypothetical protein P3G55_12565 [Leptospira sp. 96542]|nr:hypothetical protein [Leptospira sp. 96542]
MLYPIILFLCSVLSFLTLFILKVSIFLAIPFIFVSILTFSIAIHLISAYKGKIRSINLLFKKNRVSFKPISFADYMQAPCGRQVVKIVLSHLGKQENYKILKMKYPIQTFKLVNSKTRIVFYKNGEMIPFITDDTSK